MISKSICPALSRGPPWTKDQIAKAAALINRSERPLILAGHGIQIAGVSRELLQLVEKAEIPVVTTLLGTGNIPESHPLSLGMGGMHGEAYANRAIAGLRCADCAGHAF
jgi:acetolactate synthase-1/2/3 large subunit